MKFKIISMLITLAMLSVAPLIYMGKFNPLEFFDTSMSKGASEFKQLKAKAPKSLSSVVSDKKVQVYKWRDKHGVMQFSNTPPPTDKSAEQVTLDPNKNVIDAVKIPPKEEPKAVAQTQAPSPYSVKGMKKVMNDAKGVEEMLKKRDEDQRKAMDGI